MKLKTLQWNIGGGKLLKQGDDPALIVSYSIDGIHDIAKVIRAYEADIVTLNEVQFSSERNQAEQLSKLIGLEYFCSQEFSESHIDKANKLGMAILSRYPLKTHNFKQFFNPKYEVTWEDGSQAVSYDKGILTAKILIPRVGEIVVETLHAIPFRRFEVDALGPDSAKVRQDMTSKISYSEPRYLLQGDFNFDSGSLREFLPTIYKSGLSEINQKDATTPKNRRYDHILYHGMLLVSTQTITTVKTDHYPVAAEFEI